MIVLYKDEEWRLVKHPGVVEFISAAYMIYHFHKRKKEKKQSVDKLIFCNTNTGECTRCQKKIPKQLLMLVRLLKSNLTKL